ncbi:hypothetical protein ACQUW5_09580 [Legionella sp. CNM-1927-20]|uniref:hypothetical protein n=1 Tax=Legionella sp. CNM-1927-20 TaxID=3422221 RepID=UPI00403A98A5
MKIFIKSKEIVRYNKQQNLFDVFESLLISNHSFPLTNKEAFWNDVAVIILQDLEKKGIKIANQIIDKINSSGSYNNLILNYIIEQLYRHPNYHLFLEKLALKLSDSKERMISLTTLQNAGISNLEKLEKVVKEFLLEQKKLAKSSPNLRKIRDDDDFEQLIDCLAVNPLYENFLHAFTRQLAYEFNKSKEENEAEIVAPEVITYESLLQFFQSISTDITLKLPDAQHYKKRTLYVTLNARYLDYTILKNDGELVRDVIRFSEINDQINEEVTEEDLKQYLPNILKITATRGHTNRLALNNTVSLRDRAIDFINKELNPDLHATNLPSSYFIKSEEAKFILHQWLEGNLPQLTQHLIADSHLRYIQQLDTLTEQAKNHIEMNGWVKDEIDAVRDVMKKVVYLVASKDKQDNERNDELDRQIRQLVVHLKSLKTFYDKTPLLLPNENFPKTEGNFSEFVKNIILNKSNDRLIEYNSQDGVWHLEWDSLINALVKGNNLVQIHNQKTSKKEYLKDNTGQPIPALTIFGEELKVSLVTRLRHECLRYHEQALQDYQKEQLSIQLRQSEAGDFADKLSIPTKPFNLPTISLEEARREAYRYYNMRHILTLKSYKAWTSKEKNLQQIHNRILQPNFMEGILDEQLKYAQIAQEEWLTDVLVPRLTTALYLNIAVRLITDYRVEIEDVNKIAKQLWHEILLSNVADHLIADWQEMSTKMAPLSESHFHEDCLEKARQRMSRIYPDVAEDTFDYDFKFKSCLEMEKNKVRKRLVNQVTATFLDKYLEQFASQANLQKKPQFPIGENKDYVFIGPAASGKSTISNQYIQQHKRLDYVSMATDDYRGIYLPATDNFECRQTDQMFIRTQDSAYLVSELVEERMSSLKNKRPNIIVDGVTYKQSHRNLVETNNNSFIVCACLDDASEVVKRSYNRAIREDSSSADKGRYVNTTSLLHMHKTASMGLIAYCAPNTTIAFYNTNIRYDEVPSLIATIDTHGEKTLTIHDERGALFHLTSFFNKKRLNVSAKNDGSLFISKLQKPAFQVESLFAVLNYQFKIVLKDKDGNAYLTFKKNDIGNIEMTILNSEWIRDKLSSLSSEKELLKMMLLYGQYGSLKEVQKQCIIHEGANNLVENILSKVIPNQALAVVNQMV